MSRPLACLAAILLLCSIAGHTESSGDSQNKAEEDSGNDRFKVKTELMEVRTVVTDQKGRIVENLKADDFELLENDQRQKIDFFSISQVAGTQAKPEIAKTVPQRKPVELPTVQQRLTEAPVRTTLLLVDNLHLNFESLNQVKQALRRFIDERVTDQDMVALAASSGTLGIAQQFTRNRQILRHAIEQIRIGPLAQNSFYTPSLAARVVNEASVNSGSGGSSMMAAEASRIRAEAAAVGADVGRLSPNMSTNANAIRLAVDIIRRESNIYCPCSLVRAQAQNRARQVLSEASYARKNLLAILRDFSSQMMNLPGKRVIVVFSNGFTSYDSSGDLSYTEAQSAINRAVRAGVVIYSIDAKGVRPPPTIDASRNQASASFDCGEDPIDPSCLPPDPESLITYVTESEREEMNGLHSIAQDTGGKLFNDTNNLGDALGRAFDANRYYYVLSYYLSSSGNANKFRNVKVRVRNHPEYTVRTARGFAPLENDSKLEDEAALTPQQRLLRSMNLPLPVTDIPVSAQADFVETQNDDKQATITVYLDGEKFQYHEQDQRSAVELEILYAIYDGSGKQVDAISTHVEGKLSSERLEQAKTSGYRFSRRVTLKPGVYQVRVGVREIATDHMGTASAWVEIPELTPAKLEMSSLMLRSSLDTNPEASEGINVSELEQIKMVQGIPLYDRSDFCDYAFRVYEGNLNPAGSELMLRKELLRDGEPVKQEPWRPISSEDRNKDTKGWFDLDGDVELSGFTPGVYELRISVKNAAANNVVQRSAVFGVE